MQRESLYIIFNFLPSILIPTHLINRAHYHINWPSKSWQIMLYNSLLHRHSRQHTADGPPARRSSNMWERTNICTTLTRWGQSSAHSFQTWRTDQREYGRGGLLEWLGGQRVFLGGRGRHHRNARPQVYRPFYLILRRKKKNTCNPSSIHKYVNCLFSISSNPSHDDLIAFEMAPSCTAVWEARVREAARQISAAANKPQPSIRSRVYLFFLSSWI